MYARRVAKRTYSFDEVLAALGDDACVRAARHYSLALKRYADSIADDDDMAGAYEKAAIDAKVALEDALLLGTQP